MSDDRQRRITLILLGGFSVVDTRSAARLPPRARRLVAYLAIQQRPHARETLAESLWPGRTPRVSRLNLRQAVHAERHSGHDLIHATREEAWLAPAVMVDYHLVTARVRNLLADIADGATDLDPSNLVDDLLPTWDEEWLVAERERFRELRLHGLERLTVLWLRRGCVGRAIDAALMATTVDPLRESSHALLIRAYLAEANRTRALDVYNSYRRRIRRELGVEPSAELAAYSA